MTERNLIIALTAGYCLFGLTFDGLAGVSRIGIVFALALLFLGIRSFGLPKGPLALYAVAMTYLVLSWSWAEVTSFEYVGSLVTTAAGAIGFALLVASGALSPRDSVILLMIPGFINVAGYLAGIDISPALETVSSAELGRFGGLAGNPNRLTARAFLPVFFYLLVYFPLVGKGRNLFLLGACLFLILGSFATSGSRRSLLMLLVCVPGIVACVVGDPARVRWRVFFAGVCLIVGLVAAEGYGLLPFISDLEVMRRMNAHDAAREGSSTYLRLMFLQVGWDLFLQRPLFGSGLGEFLNVSRLGLYAHNNLIEIAVNGGLVGLGLYYAPLVWSIALLVKNGEARIAPALAFSAIGVLLVLEMTGVSYRERADQLMYCLLLVSSVILAARLRTPRDVEILRPGWQGYDHRQ